MEASLTPASKRELVLKLQDAWRVSERRAAKVIAAHRYCLAGLNLRAKRPRRRRMASHRSVRPDVTQANDCWTFAFVSDALFNGRRFRALRVMDQFTREWLAIYADQHIKGEQVVGLMRHLTASRGIPRRLQTDNGSEFISKTLDRWAYEHRMTMDFSRPGRLTDNPFIESFNGSFRDECLSVHWFLSLEDAREKIENWRVDYEMPSRVQPFQAALCLGKHPAWTVCPAGRRLFIRSFSILSPGPLSGSSSRGSPCAR